MKAVDKWSMIRLTIAFLATSVTLIQSLLIYLGGSGICLNDGCEVVERLTTVSPLIFNIGGLLFFQTLFWTLFFARKGSDSWQKIAKLLLHAALCAEAVLIFFQYQIAQTFCFYCLIIFSCIVLLNLLFGLRQIATGITLFLAIFVACYSLYWQTDAQSKSLEDGSIALVAGEKGSGGGYLFFSQNCNHCEKVIDLLRRGNSCKVRFNPVDEITDFSFPGAVMIPNYNLQVNLDFLKLLSVKEIPVLVTGFDQNVQILRGEFEIQQYLLESCQLAQQTYYSGSTSIAPTQNYITGSRGPGEDGCPVTEDCDENLVREQ